MKTADKGRSCSCNRVGYLDWKLCDPLLFPRFIRARVTKTETFSRSPERKNPGVFNNFNKTSNEPILKQSKRFVSPINKIEKIKKFIRTYNPEKSDPIICKSFETVKNCIKKPFEPSQELIKYNDDRFKIQRKKKKESFSKSQEIPQKKVSEMKLILQFSINSVGKITPKPQEIPFKVLKSRILSE